MKSSTVILLLAAAGVVVWAMRSQSNLAGDARSLFTRGFLTLFPNPTNPNPQNF